MISTILHLMSQCNVQAVQTDKHRSILHHNKRMASRAAAALELRWGFWRAGEPRAWQAHKRRRSTPFVWQHGCRNSAQTRHSNSYSRGISRAAGQRCTRSRCRICRARQGCSKLEHRKVGVMAFRSAIWTSAVSEYHRHAHRLRILAHQDRLRRHPCWQEHLGLHPECAHSVAYHH